MRCTLFLLLAIVNLTSLFAQVEKIEKSVAIDEPDQGWNKILLLSNDKTFYFHLSKSDGIVLTVFDKDRKLVDTKSYTSELWDARKMKTTHIVGLYEINHEAVLFMVQSEGREPTLYRLRFSTDNGSLTKEQELGSLPRTKLFASSGEINDIYVEKDPESDCYAVIYFNGYASDKDERIKVDHFNGEHKLIHSAFYDSPDENFKFLRFIGAVVDGDKRLFVACYGAANQRGREGRVYISRLQASESSFTNKSLDYTEDFRDTKSVMYYNHNNNIIQMLTMSFDKGRANFFSNSLHGDYSSFLSYIDPDNVSLKRVSPVSGSKLSDYAHNVLGFKQSYVGLPQQMVINKDNSTTILSEDLTQEIITDDKGNIISTATYLGAIGINEINPDGSEKNGEVIMKVQKALGLINPLYISSRCKGRWRYTSNGADYNSYLSYDFISTEKGRYILFNDNPKNFDKEEDERRRKVVVNINKINTICYSLDGDKVNKFYIFGDPEKTEKRSSCHIEASDYRKATNTYSTILVEREGRDKETKIVWVKFK